MEISNERIQNLKRMYKKYRDKGFVIPAERVLAQLRTLGVSEEEVQNMREDWENNA